MTHVHTDRTSFFHVLKVPTKNKTRCVKILGSSSLFRRHQESFVTAEANGRRSLPISISSCRFTSTPLYVPLLSPHVQTSRLGPFLNGTFFSDPVLPKCHFELPVFLNHMVLSTVQPLTTSTSGLTTTCFCRLPCLWHKPLVGFL